ncbi:MAG: FGGY-family carbohydrate kinase [Clostridia bacterium]|nr:FGGY-family carbohydrate kinase [Clostridia bacterium]
MKYVFSIDGGSQSTKVAIYDMNGRAAAESRVPLQPLRLGPDGLAEHPGDDLWDTLCRASRETMEKFSGDPADILGVGLCTIRFCRCLLRADGTLAQPVMSWMDARVSRPHAENNPDCRYITTTTGYTACRLTGETVDTAANNLGAWPLDLDSFDWYADDARLSAFGAPRDRLFRLVQPGAIIGPVTPQASRETGIPAGLPVVATANDKAVEALGVGLVDESAAVISLGTYIASMVTGRENAASPAAFWVNLACMPRRYLYESHGIRRGMWMLSWFISVLGEEYAARARAMGLTAEQRLEGEALAVPPGSGGLMCLPDWLAPVDQPHRRGMLLGFDARHTRAHIYRALLESIALTMKRHLEAMLEELGRQPERVILSGGGAQSDLFMQIFADVLNLPVERRAVSGAAGVGAAICAAVAAGFYPSFEEAAAHMVHSGARFQPIPENAALYAKMDDIYRTLPACVDAPLRAAFPLF